MCADCITLPELFRARGYRTAGAGKLQHKTEWSIDADASGRSRGFTEPFVRIPLLERKGVRENGQRMYHSHATPPVRCATWEQLKAHFAAPNRELYAQLAEDRRTAAAPPEERPFEPFDEEKECTPCAA